ncbi:MAG: RNA polymerase sigma factor [Flavobacteriales bacterium]|nr:RNA polymerase sigma factor [Flavobacteriales bacterium]
MKVVKTLHSDKTDEWLMESISAGDTASFNELYERYHKKITWYFYRMLGQNQELSEDCMQDLFMKIIERPELFDPSRKFSTWIFSVANNRCKNEYRKLEIRVEKAHLLKEDDYTEAHFDQVLDNGTFKKHLFDELGELGENQRSSFLLRHKYGFSIKQISEILECSEGTIKSRLFYITKKLSKKLNVYNPNTQTL